jgi:hypothetical protein
MNHGFRSIFNLAGRVLKVSLANDVVAVENGVGLVAGNFTEASDQTLQPKFAHFSDGT